MSIILKRKNRAYAPLLAFLLVLTVFSFPGRAEIEVRNIEAGWEDSLAVVQLSLLEPFSEASQEALHTGLPIALDVELRISKLGYVRRAAFRIEVWYNVWRDQYRIITPLGPIAVEEYETLLKFFRDSFVIPLTLEDLPGNGPWYIRARASDQGVLEQARELNIDTELNGITGWLFRQSRESNSYSEWTARTRLPRMAYLRDN